MPRLWNETIESHRRNVRDAILDTTAALVDEHGLRSVTMSQIAEETGIGRATLYKYFGDVEAVLLAWHEREIAAHLRQLAEIRDQAGTPGDRLRSVLEAYALIAHESHGHDDAALEAVLHRGKHLPRTQQQVHRMLKELIGQAAASAEARSDVSPDELATYCLHAVSAAGRLPNKAAARRLVAVTLGGLRPPPSTG
ncbi:MAG TPA: TetR/AcrR family transcriptional regulator [Actinomycetota bacterium]|nr:TetR/AcrR family transcriptional regulator [Actinomycetota bacterium]